MRKGTMWTAFASYIAFAVACLAMVIFLPGCEPSPDVTEPPPAEFNDCVSDDDCAAGLRCNTENDCVIPCHRDGDCNSPKLWCGLPSIKDDPAYGSCQLRDIPCRDIEVCNNDRDDNCNGEIDEFPCEQLLGGPECAPGTSEGSDGRCHPDPTACAEGTEFDPQAYKCVPMSAQEQDVDCIVKGGPQMPCYRDLDGDGYGGQSVGFHCSGLCSALGFTDKSGDCDDSNPGVHPNVTEVCDGLDNNCDGKADESDPLLNKFCVLTVGYAPTWDQYIPTQGRMTCATDGTKKTLECLPYNTGSEVCGDGLDNNCDGKADEGCLGSKCQAHSECATGLQCSTPALTTDGQPGGVCAIPCKTGADCPTGSQCFNTWSNGYTSELLFSCLPAK